MFSHKLAEGQTHTHTHSGAIKVPRGEQKKKQKNCERTLTPLSGREITTFGGDFLASLPESGAEETS